MIHSPFFQQQAISMAERQAAALLSNPSRAPADMVVAQAAQLIMDCVQYLNLPTLAVRVALDLHEQVARWAAWGPWARALDALLALPDHAYPVDARLHVLLGRSQAAREVGDHPTAITTAAAALHLADAHGDQAVRALARNVVGLAAFHGDDLERARAAFHDAYLLGHEHLAPLKLGHITMNLGVIAEQQGRFAEAHAYLDRALGYYHMQDSPVHVAKARCNRANVHRKQGLRDQAISELQAACALLHTIDAHYEYALATNDLGYAYLQAGHYVYAEEAFHEAHHRFETIHALRGQALVMSNLAELYVTTRQWPRAERALHDARTLATACVQPVLVAAIDVDAGRMAHAQGDVERAKRLWATAVAVQETRGAAHAAEQTRQLLATILRNDI